ncbi:hypothetical protein, partial [Neotabrizicola sp. sgz301269]|uniref:hypothetical protein n=1 Tax=Neotabrizicola sp. sgz301269 TaxID=3276282 RepID=UPI00376F8DF7
MILVQYCPDGTPTFTVPAGWNLISTGSLSDPSQRWLWKFAASLSESLSFTLDASAVETFAAMAIAIRNVKSGTTPVAGTIDQQYNSTSRAFVAPAPAAYGASVKGLYIVGIGRSGAEAAQTAAPTDWTGFDNHDCGSVSSATGIAQAWRQYEGTALPGSATWSVSTRFARTQIIGFEGTSGAAVAASGASLTISPESPVETDTVTFAFTFSAGTAPISTSLTINGVTTTTTTGVHTRTLPAGSYPYTWSSSNAAGAGPSGSGTLVVAAAPTITASVSLSPSSPTAGQTVTATVTVSPTDATPGLSVVNGGSSVSITSTGANTWTFTAPATGTTTVTPTATLDATVVSGTPATFSTGAAPVSANAPKLWGVPEVGDLLEFIAGTGVSSPSYLIERTDNGGSTYATEKTATAGE